MNRQIKFRAWDGTEMYQLDQITMTGVSWYCGGKGVSLAHQPSISVMQFTGLLDKNGKEIYEGDILRIPEYYETPESTEPTYVDWEVFFVHGAFNIRKRVNHEIDISEDTLAQTMHAYDQNIEIIGNIHENQELLK